MPLSERQVWFDEFLNRGTNKEPIMPSELVGCERHIVNIVAFSLLRF
jgi:hypothetical protein